MRHSVPCKRSPVIVHNHPPPPLPCPGNQDQHSVTMEQTRCSGTSHKWNHAARRLGCLVQHRVSEHHSRRCVHRQSAHFSGPAPLLCMGEAHRLHSRSKGIWGLSTLGQLQVKLLRATADKSFWGHVYSFLSVSTTEWTYWVMCLWQTGFHRDCTTCVPTGSIEEFLSLHLLTNV